jgi:proteic killer suppression protein
VEIVFADERLRDLCNGSGALRRKYGTDGERKIRQRLDERRDAGSLAVVRTLPGPRCEELELRADRKGQLSVRLHGGCRLIFAPEHHSPPVKPDGGLDWTATTAIRILAIEDYHD